MGRSGLSIIILVLAFLSPVYATNAANDVPVTVIYDDAVNGVRASEPNKGELWIPTADLARATGFELKPQGVCRERLCFPLPKARRKEFLREVHGEAWFHLTEFARLVDQPVVHDTSFSLWYFGLRSDQRLSPSSLQAPDFSLPDPQGKMHSLSDFRNKKVILVTWASW